MKSYTFRHGSPFRMKDAPVVGAFIEKHFPHGDPDPAILARLAGKRDSPIRHLFEWDDSKAADKWRKEQARKLISALCVVVDDGARIKAFERVYIKDDKLSGYLAIDTIAKDKDLYAQVVERAKNDLRYWTLKYERYSEYFPKTFKAVREDLGGENKKKEKHAKEKRRKTSNAISGLHSSD